MKIEYDTMVKVNEMLSEKKKPVRFAEWNEREIECLNKHLFLTSKPHIYLVNLSKKDYIRKKNKWLAKIKAWIDENDPQSTIIPFSGAFELEVSNLILIFNSNSK